MKSAFVLLFCAMLAVPVITDDDMDQAENKWSTFKSAHGRRYNPSEDAVRKELFLKTDAQIQQHNSENHTFKIGHNALSDKTEEEKKKMLGAVAPNMPERFLFASQADEDEDERQKPPASLDYRKNKCLIAVKNQGQCGSCWTFSAIVSLEFSHCKKYGRVPINLSEQQIVDCDKGNGGCNGGWPASAWTYIKNAGGSALTSAYPYKAVDGTCQFTTSMAKAKVSTSGYAGNTVSAITNALVKYGPLSVAIEAQGKFFSYKSGVYAEAGCPNDKRTVNHAVNIVGYGTLNGVDYWVVRNSWGSGWGNGGYILMKKGVNLCNIESYVYWVAAA